MPAAPGCHSSEKSDGLKHEIAGSRLSNSVGGDNFDYGPGNMLASDTNCSD